MPAGASAQAESARMLRNGFIPLAAHGVLEYLEGLLFVVAPFVFDFDSGSGKAVSIVLGLAILVAAAVTEAPTGLSRTIPVRAHAVIDWVIAAALIASPFLFGFSDESRPTALFIAVGVVHLLMSIGTRYLPPREELRQGDVGLVEGAGGVAEEQEAARSGDGER